MCVHDIIHDLHPALQSYHLNTHTQTVLSLFNIFFLYSCAVCIQSCFAKNFKRKFPESERPVWNLKYDDPGVSDVVEVDGSFVWVFVTRATSRIILIPVDTESRNESAGIQEGFSGQAQRLMMNNIIYIQTTPMSGHTARRHVTARHDAVVLRQRTDEGPLVFFTWRVVLSRKWHACRP